MLWWLNSFDIIDFFISTIGYNLITISIDCYVYITRLIYNHILISLKNRQILYTT